MSDSEGAIDECFRAEANRAGPKAQWIVRAGPDRALTDGAGTLTATLARGPVLGTLPVEVSPHAAQSGNASKRRHARSERTAAVTVQACAAPLQAPWRPQQKLANVTVNAVLVREVEPPAGAPPIEWLLLTSWPMARFAPACAVIHYYTCRWESAVFFRVLQSGCTVEELPLETAERFTNCVALYLIVAWRVRFVTRLGRACPEMPCDAVFTEDEWRAVYQIVTGRPATAVPRLGELVALIAQMGGYWNRQHDGPPGPQTIWIGLQRTRDFVLAWSRLHRLRYAIELCVTMRAGAWERGNFPADCTLLAFRRARWQGFVLGPRPRRAVSFLR